MDGTDTLDDVLAHYGVKGMKWGVRKQRRREAKADKKYEKKANSNKTYMQAYNAAARRMNDTEVNRINKKYEGIDFTDPKNTKKLDKYLDEYNTTFASVMQAESNKIMGRKPSTKKLLFEPGEDGTITAAWREDDYQHSDITEMTPVVKTNKLGHIVSISFVEPLVQSMDLDDVLAHYGVKGMKWGVRRKKTDSGSYEVVTKERPGKKVKTSGGKNLPASEDAKKAAVTKQKAKSSTTDSLSNAELKELVTRMNLEQQYSRLSAEQRNPAVKFASDLLTGVGKQQSSSFANQQVAEAIKTRS